MNQHGLQCQTLSTRTFEVLSHCDKSAIDPANGPNPTNLFEYFRHSSFIDFDELLWNMRISFEVPLDNRTYLQFIQVAIELMESLEQRDKVRRRLGVGDRSGLDNPFLIDQRFQTQRKLT